MNLLLSFLIIYNIGYINNILEARDILLSKQEIAVFEGAKS